MREQWNKKNNNDITNNINADRRVIGVETFYHPLHRVWNGQDGGESTVMDGDWTTKTRNDRVRHHHRHRRQLVSIVR